MKIGTRFRTVGKAIVTVKKASGDYVVAVCEGCGEESGAGPDYYIRDHWINDHIATCHALPSK